jgi:hypothetical protein
MTAPNEKMQTSASLLLKRSAILAPVDSEYQLISELPSENFEGA